MLASYQDCLSRMASAETVRDLLLAVTISEKWLPAMIVSVIVLPAESWQEAQKRTCSAGSNRSRTVSAEPNMTVLTETIHTISGDF